MSASETSETVPPQESCSTESTEESSSSWGMDSFLQALRTAGNFDSSPGINSSLLQVSDDEERTPPIKTKRTLDELLDGEEKKEEESHEVTFASSINSTPRPHGRRKLTMDSLQEGDELRSDDEEEDHVSDPKDADEETGRDTTSSPDEEDKTTKWKLLPTGISHDALRFGIRMSVVLTACSLFVLIRSPHDESRAYPQGTWVMISALMVSWFPNNMAAASVLEKTFQRVVGTIIGAILGIALGILSVLIPSFKGQGVFIGWCVAAVTFGVSFTTIQFKNSFFGKYSYAALLCLLTFGISIMPFYTDSQDQWVKGAFRTVNVIFGCFIGGLGAIFIFPKSIKRITEEKIQTQVRLAGEASDAVLCFASQVFEARMMQEERTHVATASTLSYKNLVDEEIDDSISGAAHEKYNKALADWKSTKAVFPLNWWDPFRWCRSSEEEDAYRKEAALTLARALRIQTTIVLIDGIVRNDRDGRCSMREIVLFREIGGHIKTMLTPPFHDNEAAAEELLDCLEEIRRCVVQESVAVAAVAGVHKRLFCGSVGKSDFRALLERKSTAMPLCVRSKDNCSLLFLQLVEHLIVRTLRLYYIWKQVEK